mgnify:CR=1 FL=1
MYKSIEKRKEYDRNKKGRQPSSIHTENLNGRKGLPAYTYSSHLDPRLMKFRKKSNAFCTPNIIIETVYSCTFDCFSLLFKFSMISSKDWSMREMKNIYVSVYVSKYKFVSVSKMTITTFVRARLGAWIKWYICK